MVLLLLFAEEMMMVCIMPALINHSGAGKSQFRPFAVPCNIAIPLLSYYPCFLVNVIESSRLWFNVESYLTFRANLKFRIFANFLNKGIFTQICWPKTNSRPRVQKLRVNKWTEWVTHSRAYSNNFLLIDGIDDFNFSLCFPFWCKIKYNF